ncbi:MAG: NAD-dependent epimerase/dehydratase family protein [Deltaproteobacteria bacterium]|nr:NAD-dependent epimerase/dehydratase family protein [Deltaproteobacteria bacterium]MBW2297108.1 NAD-dependent epimerase/dehydratase family protein [Deltaproteobacteria bacterium]
MEHSQATNVSTHSRRVLVTGGGGFLGKAIVQKLIERGDRVTSFSRSSYAALERMGVEQIKGDLGDRPAVAIACRGKDIVFHVAAKAGFWGPYKEYFHANVLGTENVISACLDQNVPYLVYCSSANVLNHGNGSMEGADETVPYPKSFLTSYQKTKALAEQKVVAAAADRLKTIVLRPHHIWGPGDRHFIPRILDWADKIRMVGDGKNLSDNIYIDNAAEAHLQSGDALRENNDLSGRIYFISQGEPVYLWDMINNLLKTGGKSPVTRSISRQKAYAIGALLELVYKVFHLKSEPRMTRFLANELSAAQWFDISAARKDWGFNPKVTTEEGLKQLKKWLEDNQYETD